MNGSKVKYNTKTAIQPEIFSHLQNCSSDFTPPLDEKVDIGEYSKKIFEKSVTFEAWVDKSLIGLVAAYFNNTEDKLCYITNVSVINNYKGLGIASELLKSCMNYAIQNNFKEIILEVSQSNNGAIHLYEKQGFKNYGNKNDLIIMKLELIIHQIF